VAVAVEPVEYPVDCGCRDAAVVAFRHSEVVAYGGEQGEVPFEVCCGSVAHNSILPGVDGDRDCAARRRRDPQPRPGPATEAVLCG